MRYIVAFLFGPIVVAAIVLAIYEAIVLVFGWIGDIISLLPAEVWALIVGYIFMGVACVGWLCSKEQAKQKTNNDSSGGFEI